MILSFSEQLSGHMIYERMQEKLGCTSPCVFFAGVDVVKVSVFAVCSFHFTGIVLPLQSQFSKLTLLPGCVVAMRVCVCVCVCVCVVCCVCVCVSVHVGKWKCSSQMTFWEVLGEKHTHTHAHAHTTRTHACTHARTHTHTTLHYHTRTSTHTEYTTSTKVQYTHTVHNYAHTHSNTSVEDCFCLKVFVHHYFALNRVSNTAHCESFRCQPKTCVSVLKRKGDSWTAFGSHSCPRSTHVASSTTPSWSRR